MLTDPLSKNFGKVPIQASSGGVVCQSFSRRKMVRRTGQTQIISAVLITGIAIAVVSIAYVWGVPLIQKGQVATQVTNAENLMISIERSINDVIQAGGQRSVQVNLEGNLEVSESDNAIVYTIRTRGANIAADWVPINEDEMFGVIGTDQEQFPAEVGKDRSGVIIARAVPVGNEYDTTYRLAYRELVDTQTLQGFLVQIKVIGNNIATPGQHFLVIRKGEIFTAPQTSKAGGALLVTPVEVTVS